MSSCTSFIKSNHHPHGFEREITKIEGVSKFSSSFALEFSNTINIHPENHTVFKFGTFAGTFTIFRRLCAFSRHLAQIIQIQTIGTWKGAQKWSGKPCSCILVNFHAFYKEWAEISSICVPRVNHKRVVYWFFNYRKMKYMLEKHDVWMVPWYGLTMPW